MTAYAADLVDADTGATAEDAMAETLREAPGGAASA